MSVHAKTTGRNDRCIGFHRLSALPGDKKNLAMITKYRRAGQIRAGILITGKEPVFSGTDPVFLT
jgi:hypothetical protein